jgi:hypothetical protein
LNWNCWYVFVSKPFVKVVTVVQLLPLRLICTVAPSVPPKKLLSHDEAFAQKPRVALV